MIKSKKNIVSCYIITTILLPFFLGNILDDCANGAQRICKIDLEINSSAYLNFEYFVCNSGIVATGSGLDDCGYIIRYNVPGEPDLYDIIAINNEVLIAVGEKGSIVRYDKLTWQEVNSPTTLNLNKITESNGTLVAVGDAGVNIKSTDLGLTWELGNPPSSNQTPVFNSLNGKSIKNNSKMDSLSVNLTDVYIDPYLPEFIQVVGENLSLYQTFSGGVAWQKIDLTKPGGSLLKIKDSLPTINRIFHIDGTNAYLVGDSGVLIKTTNNFSSIEYIDLQTAENLNDIYFISPDSGVVVGDNGTIRFSTDGGNGWSEDPDITAQLNGVNLRRISVYNYNIGTIIADSGLSITVARDSSYFTAVEDEPEIVLSYSLSQNYPNPFNPTTKIKYSIPSVETEYIPSVQLKIYDLLGKEVTTLVNEKKQPGNYEVEFNASSLPSGVYFYKLSAGNFTETKKLVLLK